MRTTVLARCLLRVSRVALAGFAVALTACSGSTEPKACVVSRVSLSPATPTVLVGGTATLTATTTATDCDVLAPTWQSNTSTVASVAGTGSTATVTGVTPGTTIVTATVNGTQGVAVVTVNPVPVASVTVTPNPGTVPATRTLQLTVVLKDGTGATLDRGVTWSSSATGIATVHPLSGLVTALAAGSATITATSEGVSGTAAITVTPVPVAAIELTVPEEYLQPGPGTDRTSTTITAVTRDAGGTVLTGRTVTWSTSNPAVAGVNGGVVSALAVGTTVITATSEGVSRTATINVVRAFGLVVADRPQTVAYTAGSNSAGKVNGIIRTGTGQYAVTFPDLGRQGIGRRFVAMVSPLSGAPNATLVVPAAGCHVRTMDTNTPLTLLVRCWDPVTGADKDAAFRAMVIGESALGGAHAFSQHLAGSNAAYSPDALFSFSTSGGAMTITPNTDPGNWNNVQIGHDHGAGIPNQLGFVQVYAEAPGPSCFVRNNVGGPTVDVLCFERNGDAVDRTHQVLRLTSGRPGRVFGSAFLDAADGANTGQGFASTGAATSTRTADGKYTVVFPALSLPDANVGVAVNSWGSNWYAACSHMVTSTAPLTIDIACFNPTGQITGVNMSTVSLLVLR